MAGLCAALSAARHGARTIIMQDRPVFGGNASSEIRVHISAALGPNNLETGIIEEIKLENMFRNPYRIPSLWDAVLYGKVRTQEKLTSLLNCACVEAGMNGNSIAWIRGYQTTTQTWHRVSAGVFIDCSGDSVLAPLSGAEYRSGREAASEFGEPYAPEEADAKTMGSSCLIQAREHTGSRDFIPQPWAEEFPDEDPFSGRGHDPSNPYANFWWMELGGERDTIADAEEIRDDLLALSFGVWDHVKNRCLRGYETWNLDWASFLPGKRESRRYVGDHILTANDILSGGRFPDTVAYGGWQMDDHAPSGFRHSGDPTRFLPAPSPYGIPLRSLYSRNIANLMFAGRNISATHLALSSARIMGTCSLLGQAAGTAAALCVSESLYPREAAERFTSRIQARLMDDDCFLPGFRRKASPLMTHAVLSSSEGDPSSLRDGIDRPRDEEEHCWPGRVGASWVSVSFPKPARISGIRLVFDSDLMRQHCEREHLAEDRFGTSLTLNSAINHPLDPPRVGVPATLVKEFCIEALGKDGAWNTLLSVRGNYQRLFSVSLDAETSALRFRPEASWGNPKVRIFSWDLW